jgi:hypothetical protein
MNAISEITRRNILDALRLQTVQWEGRLGESAFLSRVFDLSALPSHDRRASDMLSEVVLHRETFRDWTDDWPYDDGRLDLLRGPDDAFLRFLTEMIHPIVRDDDTEVDRLLALFNRHLCVDGFQIAVMDVVSSKRIFAAVRGLDASPMHAQARKVADELASEHVSAQITRMQSSIVADPALAIGSAKEFVESICKGILNARGAIPSGKEDLPRLVRLAQETLGLTFDKRTETTLRNTLAALATLTQGVAELRGQLGTGHGASPEVARPSTEVARFAVGIATTLGVFLWDMHGATAVRGQ